MGRGRMREGQKTFIPLRMITAGVMPIIFAQSVIIVPATIAQFSNSAVMSEIANFMIPGGTPYNVLFALLIIIFSYFYTSIIFNSVDLSENLKKQGAFIPGVKPGSATADYIDGVLARITLPGSIFLALVAIIPVIVASGIGVAQFAFGGTSHPDRRRCAARHAGADPAAPDPAQVRWLHEVGPGEVPRPPEQVRDVAGRQSTVYSRQEAAPPGAAFGVNGGEC